MKLPIEAERQNIIRIINENPVTIISGNTGCGKSTKIPEYLADEGYRVIITQPRRLAAISLARRVAKNCKSPVGFHTGLEKSISEDSVILFKTEEIVLLELLSNTEKLENTVLVIDEIHELNTCIDFMLAWIKRNMDKSDVNFKLVLMSATLEVPKLAEFFNNAPVINISASPYVISKKEITPDKLEETIITRAKYSQNILVFLPGKAEILKLAKSLRKKFKAYMMQTDIFPLYAEQSYEEQCRVFTRSFKVILATNIAQTSITIPDIDTVIDTGLENTMVYRGNVPTISLKNISKSDCIQRKGRVGRCFPGTYIMCSDTKWNDREDYNLPKIQYEDLSKYLLLFIRYHIDISELEFLNYPTPENIKSGTELLKLIGALDETGEITNTGLKMCEISLSPRLARILVEVSATSDNQLMLDVAICCLILEFGPITSDYKICSLYNLKSDLFYQLEIFKNMEKYELDPQSIDYSHLKQIRNYLPKILRQIGCKNMEDNTDTDTEYEKIKEFLISGFPDSLFVFNSDKHGFIDSIISESRKPYKNSLLTSGNRFLVGMPLNISKFVDMPENNYKRLTLATSYSLDEVLQFFSDMLTKSWSIDENEVITEHVFYHDVEITSYPLGTVDELKASHPEQFHEEKKHYPKFNQTICFLYFHDLKIKSI